MRRPCKNAKMAGDPDKLAAERTAIRDELRKMKDFPALEGFDFLWR